MHSLIQNSNRVEMGFIVSTSKPCEPAFRIHNNTHFHFQRVLVRLTQSQMRQQYVFIFCREIRHHGKQLNFEGEYCPIECA